MKHKSAKLGTLFLALTLGLFWATRDAWAFGTLLVVGAIDLVLVFKTKGTISMWIWARFRPWADAGWMVAAVVISTIARGWVIGLAVAIGVIVGHLGWQSSDLENGKQ